MPASVGSIGEVLRQNGYNTAWFGKNHNVPGWQSSQAGPFNLWPSGLGFEYFYGFIGGDVDQWDPTVFENTSPVEPKEKLTGAAKAAYNLDSDLADQAVHWIEQHQSLAPDKPFFIYYAPGRHTRLITSPVNGSISSRAVSIRAGTSYAKRHSSVRRRWALFRQTRS